MDVKVDWTSGLSFNGVAESGTQLPLGTFVTDGGEVEGFRPMELIALGLAGCTAMDVISIMGKKGQAVTSFEVSVHAERASEHPKVFTDALIEYFVTGRNINEAALVRSIQLSAEKYCPAQAMLSKTMPISLRYHIFEDEGEGARRLVQSGEFEVELAHRERA